jgi:hypothetical protein
MTINARASIGWALHAHRIGAFSPGDAACACDHRWRPHEAHHEHVVNAVLAALDLTDQPPDVAVTI